MDAGYGELPTMIAVLTTILTVSTVVLVSAANFLLQARDGLKLCDEGSVRLDPKRCIADIGELGLEPRKHWTWLLCAALVCLELVLPNTAAWMVNSEPGIRWDKSSESGEKLLVLLNTSLSPPPTEITNAAKQWNRAKESVCPFLDGTYYIFGTTRHPDAQPAFSKSPIFYTVSGQRRRTNNTGIWFEAQKGGSINMVSEELDAIWQKLPESDEDLDTFEATQYDDRKGTITLPCALAIRRGEENGHMFFCSCNLLRRHSEY
jgi:hypothetical protein